MIETLLIVILILALLGGFGWGDPRGPWLGGGVSLVVVIILLVLLLR